MHKQRKNNWCELLGWSEQKYGEFVMDKAYEYLDKYAGDDAGFKSEILQTNAFWNWWKEQWDRRNDQLLSELERSPELIQLLERTYRQYHTVTNIHIYPNKILMRVINKEIRQLDKTYGEMITGFIESEIKKSKT